MSYDDFMRILNILEDERIENYIVRLYPSTKKYLIYKNVKYTEQWLKKVKENRVLYGAEIQNVWIMDIGRLFLPRKYRMRLLKETNTFNKEDTKKIINTINEYINLGAKFGKKLKYAKHRKEYESLNKWK